MPSPLTVPQREAALHYLWIKRAQLSHQQWAELYEHVCFGLSRKCRAPELESIGDSREEHIQQFFLCKVYEGDFSSTSAPNHFGALCNYFRNFLRDILKSAKHNRETLLDDCDDGDESPVGQIEQDAESRDISDQLLFETSLDEAKVRESAGEFLASLEKPDQIYLACHSCAEDEDAEPLSSLAKRMQISSYHYRALKLGITRKKGEFEQNYEETHIGGWLTQKLGLNCTAHFAKEIFIALKMLCDESLKRYSRLCAGGKTGDAND